MNQPTEDRIRKIEERLEKLEQPTEPIKITVDRSEADSVLLQTLMTMVGTQATDIGILKHEMGGARADILAIKATQSDHGELLKEHRELLKDHTKRFDKLEKIMLQILDRLPQLEGE